MTVPARLVLFALALVVVFGISAGLGATLGPEPQDPPAPTAHEGPDGHGFGG